MERRKDTLKISGVQVSPTEIEDVIRSHPDGLVTDVCVVGVSGGRLSDEKNPRAWVVLTEEGKRIGQKETVKILDEWTKKNLSSYKWVRAGFEVVDEASVVEQGREQRTLIYGCRSRRTRLARFSAVFSRTDMKRNSRVKRSYDFLRLCIFENLAPMSYFDVRHLPATCVSIRQPPLIVSHGSGYLA